MNILSTTIIDSLNTDGAASAIQQAIAKAPEFGAVPSGSKRIAVPMLLVEQAAPETTLAAIDPQPVIVLVEEALSTASGMLDNAANFTTHSGVRTALLAQL